MISMVVQSYLHEDLWGSFVDSFVILLFLMFDFSSPFTFLCKYNLTMIVNFSVNLLWILIIICLSPCIMTFIKIKTVLMEKINHLLGNLDKVQRTADSDDSDTCDLFLGYDIQDCCRKCCEICDKVSSMFKGHCESIDLMKMRILWVILESADGKCTLSEHNIPSDQRRRCTVCDVVREECNKMRKIPFQCCSIPDEEPQTC